jgi:hypothetical protein
MQAIEDMKEELRVTLAKAICKDVSCQEAIEVVKEIFKEFERG